MTLMSVFWMWDPSGCGHGIGIIWHQRRCQSDTHSAAWGHLLTQDTRMCADKPWCSGHQDFCSVAVVRPLHIIAYQWCPRSTHLQPSKRVPIYRTAKWSQYRDHTRHYRLVESACTTLATELVVSSIPGSVRYISYPMFIEPRITRVPSGFSGYIWLDIKIVLKKIILLTWVTLSVKLKWYCWNPDRILNILYYSYIEYIIL